MNDDYIVKVSHPVFGEIDTVKDKKGLTLYDASAIAKSLGYSSPRLAAFHHCKNGPLIEVGRKTMPNGVVFNYRKRFCDEKTAFLFALKGNTPKCEAFRNWLYAAMFPLLKEYSGDWLCPGAKGQDATINKIFAVLHSVDQSASKFAEAYAESLKRLIED